jgi:uncharacterized protein YhaN
VKITALEIDGYGVWSGLRIQRLGDGLSVVYGPNEAGKTTLLQFIRSVLYGFSPERRRYFPPLHGGRPGGRLEVAGPNGRVQIDRHDEPDGLPGQDRVVVTAADGTRQGEHMIRLLLANLDEPIFNNVFAIGLREIQELGTLGDTEAAELLYSLSAGLDRVSIVDVMRELDALRNRILDRSGGPCQVVDLLAQREKLRQEIESLESLRQRYARLAAQRSHLDRDVTRLEEEKNAAEQQLRVIDLAVGLRDRWARRAALDDELSALGPQPPMPADAVAHLDALAGRAQKCQQRIERLDSQRVELRREGAALEVNAALARQAARIQALVEQEPWLSAVESQTAAVEKEISELGASLVAEHQRLGLGPAADAQSLVRFSPRVVRRLRGPARALQEASKGVQQARRDAAAARQSAAALAGQIAAALPAGAVDLAAATDRAGNVVAQLRRRIQVEERLDQMAGYETELDQQNRRLLDRQFLPVWLLAGLGIVFALGLVLVVAGVFMPASMTGSLGWALVLLGLAGGIAATAGKVLLERSAARQLDSCRKQVHMLRLQIKQAKEERDLLESQLPRGAGPSAARLAAAQQELAALEGLAPLETRRAAASQEGAAADARAAAARDQYRAARRRWRDALAAAGVPASLTPRQLRRIGRRSGEIQQIEHRIAQRREELAQRGRELEMLSGRIVQLAADCGVAPSGKRPIEQLRELADALAQQQAQIARRAAIRRQLRALRRRRARQEEAAGRLRRRRRQLFRESGVEDEQQFRRRAVDFARAEVLRRDREALDREIAAAAADRCSVQSLAQQLDRDAAAGLEVRGDEARSRLAAVEKDLRERAENRGQVVEQLRALAEDRQLVHKQLDMAVLEKRLEEALRRWQVLAVACRNLEAIRTTYEHDRQPETLREASVYLDRLTQGRYCRVWTPLGERVLRVEDAQGRSLPVELLSRGTREQLFLALRLALAACYGRRGAVLPLVLDDVLVNFDAERAGAAAAVLRDFAAAGHQLLVFTCHEHIAALFKSLRVPVGALPEHTAAGPPPVVFAGAEAAAPRRSSAAGKPKRAPRSAPPRKAAVKRTPDPQRPEDEGDPQRPSGEEPADDSPLDDEDPAEDEAADADAPWDEEDDAEDEDLWKEGDSDPLDPGDVEAA